MHPDFFFFFLNFDVKTDKYVSIVVCSPNRKQLNEILNIETDLSKLLVTICDWNQYWEHKINGAAAILLAPIKDVELLQLRNPKWTPVYDIWCNFDTWPVIN